MNLPAGRQVQNDSFKVFHNLKDTTNSPQQIHSLLRVNVFYNFKPDNA